MLKSNIQRFFPKDISFPEELGRLCDWHESNGRFISGCFELRAGDGDDFKYWFGSRAADAYLAMFGAGADGSLYCVWKQDDGREPIVHLGSEGDALMVLAGNMKDFIALLAVGYDEIGFEDLSQPPIEEDGVNLAFRDWVEVEFDVVIPECGDCVTLPAASEHQDFAQWVNKICQQSSE